MNQPEGFDELLAGLARDFSALPDLPEETPESTLRALWATAMGEPVSAQAAAGARLRDLNSDEMETLRTLIGRWQANEPLAHITKRQQFCGLELLAGPEALVPRKETEILARAVLDRVERVIAENPARHPVIIDACTGSGNLPLVYAKQFPNAEIYAADLSESAIELANRNSEFTGQSGRIQFMAGDLLAPFDTPQLRGMVDVLSCNPPYISSKKVGAMATRIVQHEPAMAFDGGPFGISIVQRLTSEAPALLRSGGWLLFEVGLGQGPMLVKKLERMADYDDVQTHCDDEGEIRVVAALRGTVT